MRNSILLAAALFLVAATAGAATPRRIDAGRAAHPARRHPAQRRRQGRALRARARGGRAAAVARQSGAAARRHQPRQPEVRGGRCRTAARVLYSRGYSTIFGEWRTTDEAQAMQRSFQESLRFPMPDRPVQRAGATRATRATRFVPVWSRATSIRRRSTSSASARPAPAKPIAIRDNGDPAHKVDLLLLGDGYTADEMGKFEARGAARWPTTCSACRRSRSAPPTSTSGRWPCRCRSPGVSRPSTGIHRASRALGIALRHLRQRALRADARQPRLPRAGAVRALRVRRDPGQQRDLWRRRHLRPVQHRGGRQRLGRLPVRARVRPPLRRRWPTSTTPRRWPTPPATRSASSRGSPTSPRCCDPDAAEVERPGEPGDAAADAVAEGRVRGLPARRTRRGARSCARTSARKSEMSALFREEQAHADELFAGAAASRRGRRVRRRQLRGHRLLPPADAMHDVHPQPTRSARSASTRSRTIIDLYAR